MLGVHTSPKMLPLHPMELFSGRKVVASVFGGFKGRTHMPHFAKQCIKGVTQELSSLCLNTIILTSSPLYQVVKLDEFITHQLPFHQINDAFQLLIDGKSLRCVLQF